MTFILKCFYFIVICVITLHTVLYLYLENIRYFKESEEERDLKVKASNIKIITPLTQN